LHKVITENLEVNLKKSMRNRTSNHNENSRAPSRPVSEILDDLRHPYKAKCEKDGISIHEKFFKKRAHHEHHHY
jgi:hypothetical protein